MYLTSLLLFFINSVVFASRLTSMQTDKNKNQWNPIYLSNYSLNKIAYQKKSHIGFALSEKRKSIE